MADKLFCFVLMPFSKEFDDTYRLGIKETIESLGHIAERVDDQIFRNETILERIKNQIASADFIVADMSSNNANVYYEVGFAHAKEKECILIANDVSEIKFDLKHNRHIEYKNITDLKRKLTVEVNHIKSEITTQNKGLICDTTVEASYLEKNDFFAEAIVNFEIEISNKTKNQHFDITAIHFFTKKGWTIYQDKFECPSSEEDNRIRHLLRSPISSLPSKDGWTKVKFTAKSIVGRKWDKDGLKDTYDKSGKVSLKLITKTKSFEFSKYLKIVCTDDIPF